MRNICAIESCERPCYGRGWCTLHYQRWERTGDPRHGTKTHPASISERFWSKVRDVGGCWVWTAAIRKTDGYGVFNAMGKIVPAHRYAYEEMRAEVPPGLVLDHLCRNRACVNPWHVEPVTDAVNIARGQAPTILLRASGKCKRGHELSPRSGGQYCLTCNATRMRNRSAS